MRSPRRLLPFLLIAVLAADNRAQQPAPGEPRGNGNYTITASVEVGARGVGIHGNADKYRSDFNYQPGFRVFDSSFLMRSSGDHGGPVDSLLVTSTGWGGDPSGYLRVNAEKTKWYRFDASVRHFDYFNSLRNLALNQHIYNTDHKLGDFDLTLLPKSDRIRVNLGYSYDRNNGPTLTTYDYSRDEFPVLSPFRSTADNYRAGIDAKVWKFDISFLQGFRYYKDDTTYLITSPQPGNNPLGASLATFRRDEPTRVRTPFTRFSLHALFAKKLDFTGRFIYASARSRFTLFEELTGRDASGNQIVLDRTTVSGDAKRPNRLGDLAVTYLATDKLRISDTFSVNSFDIDGGNGLDELLLRTATTAGGTVTLPPLSTNTLSFRTLNYRRYMNTLEVDYQFHPRFAAHVGYRYTDRHVGQEGFTGPADEEPVDFNNHANSILFGFRARPVSKWTLYFDLDRGETDNVFTRVGNYDFLNLRLRSAYKPTKTFAFSASLVTRDNTNPTIVEDPTPRAFGADINTRIYTTSVDWTPNPKLALSSGYTHTHLTSEAQVISFVNLVQTNGVSRYFMRDNFAFLNASVQLHPRAQLFAAYRIHHDSGQGDRRSTSPALYISSYPFQLQFPEVRLAFKLHNRLDWNVGYQMFDFKERFVNNQFYRAHLPYTSLRLYFDRTR